MLDSLIFAANSIIPMMLLMLLGYVLGRRGFFSAETVRQMNRFTFRFCVSAMMFRGIYTLSSLSDIRLNTMCFVLVSVIALTVLGWAEAHLFTKDRSRRGVIVQNSFRSNIGVIGLYLASSLGGAEGSSVCAGIQTPVIIYNNIMAVTVLTVYSGGAGRSPGAREVLRRIAVNPMILGQAAGIVCLVIRQFIPRGADGALAFSLARDLPFLYSAIDSLASLTAPLLLVLLGAQVDFGAVSHFRKELIVGVAHRLLIAPAVGFALALLAQRMGFITLTNALAASLVGLYASPAAVASAVMTEEIGGDAELARQYVVWTSALSSLSLFVLVLALRRMGLL